MTKKKPSPKKRRRGILPLVRRSLAGWKRLSPFFRASRKRLAALSLVSILAGFTEAALLALIASIAFVMAGDDGAAAVPLGPVTLDITLGVAFAVAIGLVAVRTALQLLMAYIPAVTSAGAIADLRASVFDSYIASDWQQKAKEREGALQALMSTHVNGTSQALLYISVALSSFFMFLTMVLSALVLSPIAAVAIIATSLFLFIGLRPLARRLRVAARALSNESKNYATAVQQVSSLAEEVQVFGASPSYRSGFRATIEAVRAPALRSRFLSQSVPALYQSVALLMLVLALIVVSMSTEAELASLGAIVLVLVRAQTFAQQMQGAISSLDEKAPFMTELADSIQRFRDAAEDPGTDPLAQLDSLELQGLGFSYDGTTSILHDVDLRLERGNSLGIVGPSGAGKSSLTQILLRLREPTSGSFLANGAEARTLLRTDWRTQVAYVPQFPQLVHGTVAENIRFYRPEISQEDVVQAAKWAHIHDEITSWPQGYDTVIGQRVNAISGGQRQRLCLARALAANPSVLILDEPTSALDLVSEKAVQESLQEIRHNRILIVIAHRLSTLSVCERVMVLVDGRVEALGTQADAYTSSPFFRRISSISRDASSEVHYEQPQQLR